MPRIPNDLLERIKQETPLRTLVERSGVGLKVSGENLIGLCRLHEDHDPRSRGSRALLGRQRFAAGKPAPLAPSLVEVARAVEAIGLAQVHQKGGGSSA